MRVAVQNPEFLLQDQARNFDGYNYAFFRLFRPLIYVTSLRHAARYYRALRRLGLPGRPMDFVVTRWDLNRRADVLLCFNGRPDLPANEPPAWFKGMKVYHGMDFVFRATEANAALERGGADYMMGYTNHGAYSDFFQKYFPKYADRVIPVPFGFAPRFADTTPFDQRTNKVVGLGSVNPVNDPTVEQKAELADYISHYAGIEWTHRWRRMLVENKAVLDDVLESRFPEWPQTKDWKYDAVGALNSFTMYANDEGLMNFPPARTYEGMACGTVIVCSDHPCYDDIGLEDGINAIRHRRHDVDDFREKVRHYQRNPELLRPMSRRAREHVVGRYSHAKVATQLYLDIEKRWRS